MVCNRNRVLHSFIPHLFVYDATGGQGFTSAGQFHTWDTTKYKTKHIIYTTDDSKIHIKKTGMYEIKHDMSIVTYYNGVVITNTYIYINGVLLNGSRVQNSCSAAAQTPTYVACQTLIYSIYLEYGDYVQIYTVTNNATPTYTMPDSSRITVKYIDMVGWDNSRGGFNVDKPNIRMR